MKRAIGLLALALAAPGIAVAQDTEVDEVLVVASTPVGSADLPQTQVPAATAVIGVRDLERTGSRSVLRALDENIGQISINGAQANPFQPNVFYRGFEASPLAGNAQGLAVYIDGVRFNQPFGDTVNWDLVPDAAIERVTVEGSNPVFGLNALGGSLDVRLKDGDSFQGLSAELSGGAFGRRDGFLEWGGAVGGASLYLSGRALNDDGWRDFSPSELRQAYGDLGWTSGRLTTHLKLLAADNDLTGNGTAPVELLEVAREAVFTHPDRTQNRFGRLTLSSDFAASDALSLQGSIYTQKLSQRTMNGDAVEIEECDDPAFDDFVCPEDEDDEPVLDADGDPIPDFLNGGTYALLNSSRTEGRAKGASLQARINGKLFDRPNRFVIGASVDQGDSHFRAQSELGELTADRGYQGPGVVVEQPDGSIASVGVKAKNQYLGLFFSSLLEVTPQLTLTVSGRYNDADVTLRDQIGTALNGDHSFSRFNPAIGLTYRASDAFSFYGGYSEANRAPTPAELSCADPAAPCSLTNFFVGDPPLEQVLSHTYEAGLRGSFDAFGDMRAHWNLSLFKTDNTDDIMFIASPILGRAYFQNVGETRRQGGQIDFSLTGRRMSLGVSYALTDATFQSPLTLNAPENPFADINGQIAVTPGDRMPGIARNKIKVSFDHELSDAWSVGVAAVHSGGQYFYGDESNLNPKTDGFTVVNLNTRFNVTPKVQIFGTIENLFDEEYETFGTFSPVNEVPLVEAPGASDTRALSPAAPRAVYVGLRLKL